MRSFFYRIQSALSRFMYGRNGSDQLNVAILAVYLSIWLIGALTASLLKLQALYLVVNLLMTLLALLLIFRTFSKNLAKRREENARFLAWWQPFQARITGVSARRKDKEHKYFTCKNCKTICRVPVGKGKLEITCPKCGNKIIGKS